jgi:hypothetical protein
MKSKFELFNEELLGGTRTLVYFQRMRFPEGGSQPDSIVVGYMDDTRIKLCPDPMENILDGGTGHREVLWRVMGDLSPMVGEIAKIVSCPTVLGGHGWYLGTFRVGKVSVGEGECHVRLDPIEDDHHNHTGCTGAG